MNFLWMEYFVAVAEHGSIRNASRQLYVSEQAIGEALRRLQKELDVELFTPTRPRGLSPSGKVFYQYATESLQLRREMLYRLTDLKQVQANTLRIGLPALGTPPFLPVLCQRFQAQYPRYQTQSVPMSTNVIADFHGADLYFLPTPLENCTLPYQVIVQDRLCLAVQRELFLRTFGDRVDRICQRIQNEGNLSDLTPLTQICIHQEFTPSIERGLGYLPKTVIYAPDVQVAVSLCLDGYGAIFTMELDFKLHLKDLPADRRESILLLPIPNSFGETGLSIGYESLTPPVDRFLQTARQYFQEILADG